MAKLAGQFFKRVQMILDNEKITFDTTVVAEVIKKHFPDWRRVLNELQRYSATGSIDSGILANLQQVSLNELVSLLKDKNFSGIRKWVAENLDNDQNTIFRKLYDHCSEFLVKSSVPALVLLLGRYQYQAAFSADSEINLMACLTEMMMELEFV